MKRSGDRLTAYLLDVHAGKRGVLPSLLRGLLSLVAPLYVLGLEAYLLPYRLGLRRRFRLPCPVVCVGNLTTGGTGKTPMTQWLCRRLLAEGLRVAILSRGYGGENEYGAAIVSNGDTVLLTATQAGDEAFLLASTLPGVPVVVGKERRVTGQLAWEQFSPDILILDDGMQFWQLHKDLEIALLNVTRPFDNGWTLPRGLLREPVSHLSRAGVVVLTNMGMADGAQLATVRSQVAGLSPNALVVGADLAPISLRSVAFYSGANPDLIFDSTRESTTEFKGIPVSEGAPSLNWLAGKRVIALSALGNPESFERTLVALGCEIVDTIRLRDHRAVTDELMREVDLAAVASGADAVLTTEKDAVKMPQFGCSVPVHALRVEMGVEREADLMAVVKAIQEEFVPSGSKDGQFSKRRGWNR